MQDDERTIAPEQSAPELDRQQLIDQVMQAGAARFGQDFPWEVYELGCRHLDEDSLQGILWTLKYGVRDEVLTIQ